MRNEHFLSSLCYQLYTDMLNYTKHTLTKVEALLTDQKYVVRYERGSFTSGYCIVEARKIAILNRFFDTAARINCLIDILTSIKIEESLYGEKQIIFYKQAMKHFLIQTEEAAQSETQVETVAA